MNFATAHAQWWGTHTQQVLWGAHAQSRGAGDQCTTGGGKLVRLQAIKIQHHNNLAPGKLQKKEVSLEVLFVISLNKTKHLEALREALNKGDYILGKQVELNPIS